MILTGDFHLADADGRRRHRASSSRRSTTPRRASPRRRLVAHGAAPRARVRDLGRFRQREALPRRHARADGALPLPRGRGGRRGSACPEVTLPVVPGMEGCHWPFRKAANGALAEAARGCSSRVGPSRPRTPSAGSRITPLRSRRAPDGVEDRQRRRPRAPGRAVEAKALRGVPTRMFPDSSEPDPATVAARAAIVECVQRACGASLADALDIQAKHRRRVPRRRPAAKARWARSTRRRWKCELRAYAAADDRRPYTHVAQTTKASTTMLSDAYRMS